MGQFVEPPHPILGRPDEHLHPADRHDVRMRGQPYVNRYVLVPRTQPKEQSSGGVVRRFSLARVGISPRSALGDDRHERLERAADPGRRDPDPGRRHR